MRYLYTVRETIAPEGTAAYTAESHAVTEDDNHFTVRLTNRRNQMQGTFGKQSVAGGQELLGAQLEVYEGSTVVRYKLLVRITSGTQALSLRGLMANGYLFKRGESYTLHEVTPPAGYAVAPDVHFTFADLELYDRNRNTYQYMVEEEAVGGYTVRYTNNGQSITNAIPDEDIVSTPTPTLPYVTPTPGPGRRCPPVCAMRTANGSTSMKTACL